MLPVKNMNSKKKEFNSFLINEKIGLMRMASNFPGPKQSVYTSANKEISPRPESKIIWGRYSYFKTT